VIGTDHWIGNGEPALLDPEYWLHRAVHTEWLKNPFQARPHSVAQAVAEYRREVGALLNRPLLGQFAERISPLELARSLDRTEWLNGVPIYGLIVNRTDLKMLPRAAPLLTAAWPRDLDRNQQSGLEPGDGCQLFASNADCSWYGVITRRGAGWVAARDLAVAGATPVDHHTTQLPALITLDPEHTLKPFHGLPRSAGMGCSFPAVDPFRRVVLIPSRTRSGELRWREAVIDGRVCAGHLAPTVPNLIRQAFKYLGRRYAWGDRNPGGRTGLDCSRLVQNVLQTLGWTVPRDSREQLAAGRRVLPLGESGPEERGALLDGLMPGSLLYTDSHALIYLGRTPNGWYAIHACYSYLEKHGDREKRRAVKRVIVSDLELGLGSSGGSLWQRLTGAVPVVGKEEQHEAVSSDRRGDCQR
jgi:cell wall-associated NlpC family hydrolase